MKQTSSFILLFLAATCCMSAASSNSVWVAISTGKPIFVAGKDEVDITFAAVNDTAAPIR